MRPFQTPQGNALADWLSLRLDGDKSPPLLLLGAGCARSCGLPSEQELLQQVGRQGHSFHSLAQLAREMTADHIRLLIDKILASPNTTTPYDHLACLVKAGVFDVILTTNWDFLLENALARHLSPRDLRVYIRGEIADQPLAKILDEPVPRVKLIKLHGDTYYAPKLALAELMNLDPPLESQLNHLMRQRGLIVAGYALKEPGFLQLARNISELRYVDPGPRDEDDPTLAHLGIAKSQHVSGKDGQFQNFVQGLCRELLGRPYRDWWAIDEGARGTHLLVEPHSGHEQQVSRALHNIRDSIRRATVDEDRVRHLSRGLLEQIRDVFGVGLESNPQAVCLVFIDDPSAPGGIEVRDQMLRDRRFADLVRRLDLRRIRIGGQGAEGRRVETWESARTLKDYRAIILIDSISFTGSTLNAVRSFLVEQEGVPADRFVAALLVMPGETRKLLEQRGWDHILAPEADFQGFEIYFPWAFTRATRYVAPQRQSWSADDGHPFLPSDRFGFTPKPWGDLLSFCNNERVSVRLLTLERGQRTSLHYHLLRDETFFILENRLRILMWGEHLELKQHESVRVPAGVPHSLIALDQPCRVLEIAEGHYDEERDIVRLSDIHQRPKKEDQSDDGLQ